MARTKKVSENMGDVIDALAAFRSDAANIRAEYARLAEEKIIKSRDNLLDLIFIKHADKGPSEIANTTGLSRSTVIRWRSEWREKQGSVPGVLQFAANIGIDEGQVHGFIDDVEKFSMGEAEPEYEFSLERSEESNVDVHLIKKSDGQAVYVIWADVFATGDSPDDGEMIERPEWVTDDVLAQAESATGLDIPG